MTGHHLPRFAEEAEEELTTRQAQVAARVEKSAAERRVEFAAEMAAQPVEAEIKVGRNERCPCGSGLKSQHRHGLPGR